MGRFFKAVKAGFHGAVNAGRASRFRAAGLSVKCQHCGGEVFDGREAQLNTAAASVLDLDWLNKSGTALACTNCGLIHWFVQEPEAMED